MMIRTSVLLLALLVVAGDAIGGPTVLGMKGTRIDCYETGDLEKATDPVIAKASWPQVEIVAEDESEDGLRLTVNGRTCWFDRSQLKLKVPTAKECGTVAQRGSRGMGESEGCEESTEKDRR